MIATARLISVGSETRSERKTVRRPVSSVTVACQATTRMCVECVLPAAIPKQCDGCARRDASKASDAHIHNIAA